MDGIVQLPSCLDTGLNVLKDDVPGNTEFGDSEGLRDCAPDFYIQKDDDSRSSDSQSTQFADSEATHGCASDLLADINVETEPHSLHDCSCSGAASLR